MPDLRELLFRRSWYAAPNLFAAGLFCLVAGLYFGSKFLAAGQVFVFVSILLSLRDRGIASLGWRRWGASAFCLAAFLLVAVLSVLGNLPLVADPLDHLAKLRPILLVLLVLAMPALVGRNLEIPWRRDSLVLAWLVPMALALAVGLYGWGTGDRLIESESHGDAGRVSGFFGQVMTFANCLQFSVVALTVFVFVPDWWRRTTRLPRWVAIAALLAASGGLYLTYTRGAMLAAAAGLVVFGAMKSRKVLGAVLVGGALVAVLAYVEGSRYLDLKPGPRSNHWRAAALAAVERPVLGWGYRNFELHSAALKERYGFEKDVSWRNGKRQAPSHLTRHAHNNYLEAFASTGVVGGLAFLAFCLCWLREAKRSRYAVMGVPLIVAFLVSGLTEDTFFDAEVLNAVLLIWLFSQWLFAHERRVERMPGA